MSEMSRLHSEINMQIMLMNFNEVDGKNLNIPSWLKKKQKFWIFNLGIKQLPTHTGSIRRIINFVWSYATKNISHSCRSHEMQVKFQKMKRTGFQNLTCIHFRL